MKITQPTQKRRRYLAALLASFALGAPASHALPNITRVVESGGDNEATDTIPAKFTGETFVNGVANEPISNTPADAPYTVGLFGEDAPMFVDRNHQWNGATTTLGIPKYLLGAEYIMSGNDNRDNPEYQLEVTISEESFVYMLIDDRLGDASNANPPNFTADRTGDGNGDMAWIVDQGWEPVKNGLNRFNDPNIPDHVGADEGAGGVGPGVSLEQWASIYMKRIPAGTFTILQPDNNGQNMYGVVVKAVPKNPFVTAAIGNLFGLTFKISNGAQTPLNTNSIAITLNGAPVTPQSITKEGEITTVVYNAPQPLPSLSSNTATLTFSDTSNPAIVATENLNFTVERYVRVLPGWAVSNVDTTKRGFLVRSHQLDDRRHILGDRGTRIPPAEKQLAGRIGPNIADTSGFTTGGYFLENTYINYNQDAAGRDDTVSNAGNFGSASTPAKNEHSVPGIPGSAGSLDHVAAEVLAYVELPAGFTTMGVNSDDGFRLTISPIGALNDKFGAVIAEFDGGRGVANTEARFFVEQAGHYAMRMMFYEGVGGFAAEWYVLQNGTNRVLVNDQAEASAPKAYYARSGGAADPTHVSVIDPFPFGSTLALAFPDDPIFIEITHGSTPVQAGSVGLKINGEAASPTVNQAGGKTTIELAPPNGLWPGGNRSIELSYNAGTAVTHSFTVPFLNYVTLEECLRTDVGTGQNPGMRWRTHQLDQTATRATTVAAAETQLTNPANAADLSTALNGYFDIDYVNFEQGGVPDGMVHDGQPEPRNAPELGVPGIPGVGTVGNPQDNITGEATTFIEFPRAGLYYMGVNRDDGFRLTVASSEGGRSLVSGPNVQELGVFNAGGGIDDNNVQTLMAVNVPRPGVWPLRLLWFEGNGGASVEWFQADERRVVGLVNDPFTSTTLRAFRTRSAQPAATNAPACSPVVTPTLAVSRGAGSITLTFTGTLQQAAVVNGPYTTIGTTSPQTIATTNNWRFYRAINP